MKKEMMILVDAIVNFKDEFNSDEYNNKKETDLSNFPDIDEYDIGYANGYSKAVYKTARALASKPEMEEFNELLSNEADPLDVVTENSSYYVEPDKDDESEFDSTEDDDFDEEEDD